MKCSQARNLIYLYRPGELPDELRGELDEHLASCTSCSAERDASRAVEERVASVRSVRPHLEDTAGLSGSILRSIDELERSPVRDTRPLYRLATAPAFRAAASLLLILTGAALFLQSYRDARDLSALEERLKVTHASPLQAGPFDIRYARPFLPLAQQLLAIPDSLLARVPTDALRHDEAGFFSRIEPLLRRPARQPTTVMDYLVEKHPRLAHIRLDDGLDEHELEILASEGEAFLHDVQLLIQKGATNHER